MDILARCRVCFMVAAQVKEAFFSCCCCDKSRSLACRYPFRVEVVGCCSGTGKKKIPVDPDLSWNVLGSRRRRKNPRIIRQPLDDRHYLNTEFSNHPFCRHEIMIFLIVHLSLDLNDTRFERIRFKRIYFCDQKFRFKREISI